MEGAGGWEGVVMCEEVVEGVVEVEGAGLYRRMERSEEPVRM